MNSKNTLIDRLLKVAKKHKVLTYPVLALVAVISFVNYFFSWSHGAGKRVVAVVLVMLMMVSQSYFLTSSATALIDDENAAMIQKRLQGQALVESETQETTQMTNTESVSSQETATTTEEVTTAEDGKKPDSSLNNQSSEEFSSEESSLEDRSSEDEGASQTTKPEKPAKLPTNSIDEEVDTEVPEYNTIECYLYYPGNSGPSNYKKISVSSNEIIGSVQKYTYNLDDVLANAVMDLNVSYSENGCFTFLNEWFYDSAFNETVGDVTAVESKMQSAGKDIIKLYCKKDLLKYQIEINKKAEGDESQEPVSFDSIPAVENDLCFVDAVGSGNDKTGTLNLTNIYRKGYTLFDISVTGGQAVISEDKTSATITFAGAEPRHKVTFNWKANTYKIKYASNDEGDISGNFVQTVTYDGVDTFLPPTGIVEDKEGYTFSNWRIGSADGEDIENKNVAAYQDKLYEQDVVLYPYYTYNFIEVKTTELRYQYKGTNNTAEQIIQGNYIGGESLGESCGYEITGGAAQLAALGINAVASQSNIMLTVADGGLTGSASGGIDLSFKITDSNAPADQNAQTFSVRVYIDQCVVKVNPDKEYTNKQYDGTIDSKISVTSMPTNIEGVTVSFKGSRYDNANVAEATKIILDGAALNVPSDENINDYVLESNSYPATISPRLVFLKTYAVFLNGKNYVRTGEKEPEFRVEEDTSYSQSGTGFVGDDSIDDLKPITFSSDRVDLMMPGTYIISAESSASSNYEIMITAKGQGKYTVKEEAPEEGVNYTITGTKGNDNWYITNPAQIQISDHNDYDTVRISKDQSNIFAFGSPVDLSEKDFPVGTSIYVQLYNSVTGAVTSWKKIDVLLDETVPEYISFTITQDSDTLYDSNSPDGLFFPTKGMVTFGNYYNNVVTVTLKYKDETSGLSKLQYGLYGEEAGTRTPATFVEKDTDGYAVARFEILKAVAETAGIINYYAEDEAGNKGRTYTLQRLDGASEWIVETAGPVIDSFVIKAGENQLQNVVSGNPNYYSNCTAVLEVSDDISGIYSVTWNVNGVAQEEERVTNTSAKQKNWIFNKDINNTNFPCEDGEYTVYAVITDNAQNTVTTESVTFKTDDEAPTIDVTTDYDQWLPSIKLEFNTYDELSGIDYIKVADANGEIIEYVVEKVEDGISYCYFETGKKGNYNVTVCDKAGNINTIPIALDKISDETPDCPTVTFIPEDALTESDWFNQLPSAVITNVLKTEDGTLVDTNYQLWEEGETSYHVTTLAKDKESVAVPMPGEGIYNLKVWSISKTGQKCEDEHVYQLMIDTIAPNIEFTTTKGSGSTIVVNFTVIDDGSGVDADTIKVLHGTRPVTTKINKTETGYTGSFEVSETGNYTIYASDIAGNASDVAAFTPMSMKIKAVTNITNTGAVLGANVIKGTFDIDSVSLSYRKYSETSYKEAEAVLTEDEFGNVAISTVLDNLEKGTAYVYKVVAASVADEVLIYEGYFKTLSSDITGVSILATARYADDSEGSITVGLFEGSVCIMAKEVNAGEEFTFENIPDGNYSIVATDGTYTKTVRLLVKDGNVIYPEEYIELVLSGKNTSVVITTDETPDVTVDNMDSIFEDDNVNYTDEDEALIEAGGTVEFKLYATLMGAASVSPDELKAMYKVTDKNKVVGAFLDLSLFKIVTEADGEVDRTRVTQLARGANLSVTIPLGELAGKPGLEVVRIHDDGENFIGSSLVDMDANPGTYTVTTNQFSTYAILYSVEEPKTEPTTEPTTEPITEDNNTTDPTTTEEPDDVPDDDDKPSEKPDKDEDKDKDKDKSNSSVETLKSPGTAKTGDETPIAVLGGMLLLSIGGIIILRKKSKN